ncbi:MAG: serine/threonine protein kinase [Ktedonobacteraceae bacterium]|nr:serine/threonine protein kinase [Ktedonobacteraceae bacterium]
MGQGGRAKREGADISNHSGPRTSQTGQLDRRTLLNKRYVIQRTIGRGGMGAVYMAKDMKRQGAICAIKEMSLSMIPPAEQAQAIQNFKIEAKILWGLNHPNLPAFTGFFTENERYFLVMEYIDGTTLEDLLESRGPFSERRVLGWARQLCDVLEYLHSQNPPIIFRDMKPGNIMLTRNGQIKLIDFGIARFFRPTGSHDTQQLGTPGFAPPEQYGGAQTDVRSDIYSLGMTLFQLLTNTLSESGFGLKDVHASYPSISPVVARALEKATAVEPQDRFSSVAEFRAALLGVGFVFDNGDLATTPQELAELCSRFPDEAADYLFAGEIEAWLHELAEIKLAREVQRIRQQIDNPLEAVEMFLQAVMGQHAHIRPRLSGAAASPVPPAQTVPPAQNGPSAPGSPGGPIKAVTTHHGLFKTKQASPVQVSPRTLDFGQVYSGISAPLSLTINGDQGLIVSGIIHTNESWIMLDQSRFDGMTTRVNVRINSTRLRGSTHYSGTIRISPDLEKARDIIVTVEVDVIAGLSPNGKGRYRHGGKTNGADLNEEIDDEYDEYDALTMGAATIGGATLSPQGTQLSQQFQIFKPVTTNGASQAQVVQATPGQATALTQQQRKDQENKIRYGQPGAGHWEPLQVSAQQRLWLQRASTFIAALMAACLWYMIIAQLSPSTHASPLPPHPWYIAVLAGSIPAATSGALLISKATSWFAKETSSRMATGMSGALLVLAAVRLIWQIAGLASLPILQLLLMLLISSLAATFCIIPTVSDSLLKTVRRLLSLLTYRVALTVGGIAGGLLGYCLTLGTVLSWFMPAGVLAGAAIALVLVWSARRTQRAKQATARNQQQQPQSAARNQP